MGDRSISDVVDGLLGRWNGILIGVVLVLVTVSVIQTYIRTRSWTTTIGAILVGAVALWGVTNIDEITGGVDNEVEQEGNTRGNSISSIPRSAPR